MTFVTPLSRLVFDRKVAICTREKSRNSQVHHCGHNVKESSANLVKIDENH